MSAPVKVSKALEEVWQWKEEAWQEVAHLPLRQALRKRMEIAERTARELGFEPVPRALPASQSRRDTGQIHGEAEEEPLIALMARMNHHESHLIPMEGRPPGAPHSPSCEFPPAAVPSANFALVRPSPPSVWCSPLTP